MARPGRRRVNEDHEHVKLKLALKGLSLAEIARMAGVSPTLVTAVSCGSRRNRKVEQLIAEVLDQTPSDLWPARYGAPERA